MNWAVFRKYSTRQIILVALKSVDVMIFIVRHLNYICNNFTPKQKKYAKSKRTFNDSRIIVANYSILVTCMYLTRKQDCDCYIMNTLYSLCCIGNKSRVTPVFTL